MELYALQLGTASTAQEPRKPNDVLDKYDFLRLLTVQLRYQDPINPISDQDFVAQMAQFTALEQMQNLSDSISELVELQRVVSTTTQAAALVGRRVVAFDAQANESVEGVVEAVRFDMGIPLLQIAGRTFTLSDVYEIRS